MIQRETATQWQDLPHVAHREVGYGRVGDPDICTCGRARTDELHSVRARELARDYDTTPVLETEKGV